jgi:RNA polymerase sigma-70 factor (ECF subfamily)
VSTGRKEDDDRRARAAVAAVLGGDSDGFSWIVERWQGPLVDLAYRFCRRPELAEELAQDAFVRVYRSLAQWRGDAAFSTWLFAIATNVYRSKLRKKRLPMVPLETMGELAHWRTEQDDFEVGETAAFVRDAVLSLPAKYREAVTLFYFHDMSVEDAARSVGVAEGTLKSHLFRGRKLLEKYLGPLLAPALQEENPK